MSPLTAFFIVFLLDMILFPFKPNAPFWLVFGFYCLPASVAAFIEWLHNEEVRGSVTKVKNDG